MQEAKMSVFSPAYWRTARAEFRNVRVLAFAGLVCAMAIVLEGLPIYLLGPSLKIYFSFLVVGLGCMCYGPCVGMMAGAIIDSVGFLLSSYGEPYFPGYLVTAVLSGFIYGVLLYTGWQKVLSQMASGKHTYSLNWPEWVFSIFLPIGAVLLIIHTIEYFIDVMSNNAACVKIEEGEEENND